MAEALASRSWDIVISDYTMPQFFGTDALALLKRSGLDLPFIFVSGTMGEDIAVGAMKAGAHDYIMKGNLARLIPAIERELREAEVHRESKRADERLRYLAYHDTVTGLPNYALLQDRLERAITKGQPENNRMALVIMELSRFREINETFGHKWADILLEHVGCRIKELLSETYMVACLRGNEFGVLLCQLRDCELVIELVGKIQKSLEQPFKLNGNSLEVQANFGIVIFPEHGQTMDSLIQRARVALSTARTNKRVYAIYSPEQEQSRLDQLTLIGELRRAIAEKQLHLVYQPKVNLRTGFITGVEVLSRWHHPDLGIIPPDRFIPLAERTGLILPLTQWVLHEAIRQCKGWNQHGRCHRLAVNLSPWNLQDRDLPEQINELLSSFAVSPTLLELEITESAIMINPSQAKEIVTRMKAMGLQFSIDDFGTGYSSLSYLKKFPVEAIKIDKSFVMEMAADHENATIVHSIIELGHNLGFKVIAEGVENQNAIDMLSAWGCDEAQGYYFSPPLTAVEASQQLSRFTQRLLSRP